jgi:S-adenosylmethionine:tRNA ribosyltransferase-isomerase
MHPRELSIHDFTYALPEERIAKEPLPDRESSKLLVFRNGTISDHGFRELPDLLPKGCLLVLNDTRVVHARIGFKRATGAALECMVLTPEGDRRIEQALLDEGRTRWWCMMGNAKRWKGEELTVVADGRSIRAARIDHQNGEHLIEFIWEGSSSFAEQLEHFGSVPLPPYMRRAARPVDDTRYNTVFADRNGSVAAPTASLHFSASVMDRLALQGIGTTRLTLHVGAGTFLPVKSGTMADHAMHSEQIRVPLETLERLCSQFGAGPVVPVGTTALRTLESIYWHGVKLLSGHEGRVMQIDQWEPYGYNEEDLPSAYDAIQAVVESLLTVDKEQKEEALIGSTSLLIAPGYRFRVADALVTNFHQPESTLLLLVAAFIGPKWRAIYDHALASDYRFLSYGDGSLLFRT